MPEPRARERPAHPQPQVPGLLLTGATGFVGQHLQQHLLASPVVNKNSDEQSQANRLDSAVPSHGAGVPITALVRSETSGRRAELLPGVKQHAFSMTSTAAWTELLAAHPDCPVILLAGSVRGRTYADFQPANVDIVAAAAKALGTQTKPPPVLLVSSLAASQPRLSHYAASKFAGEKKLAAADIPWTILRPTAVYGRGDKELAGLFQAARNGLVPRLGPADQRLSFIHVTDLCRAILAWLETPQTTQQERYSIDDGKPQGYDWAELGQAIAPGKRQLQIGVPKPLLQALAGLNLMAASLLGYQPMLSPGKARELCYPRWLCDNAPFSHVSGWQPTISLSRGAQDYFS